MTDSESIDIRRKRILYRANHRGTQELDILIGGYVSAYVGSLEAPMLDRIELLLDEEETDLQAWIMGERSVPTDADAELIEAIRNHKLGQVRS